MKLTIVLLLATSLHAESRLYRWSVGALIAGTALDSMSSYGAVELNPLLKSRDGRFAARGIAIKSGLAGGTLLAQWIIRRNHGSSNGMTVGNFAVGVGLSGIAVRNWRIR